MCDRSGKIQFMRALAEIARGAHQPSTLPVWRRELLNAREPPRVTCMLGDFKFSDAKHTSVPFNNMVYRSFFFGPDEIASIRTQIPHHLRGSSSKFEILTAFLWWCRTMALQRNDDDKARLRCAVNAHSKFNPPLPKGYYANAVACPMAVTTGRRTMSEPLRYAVGLVKKLKGEVTEEYMHSLADFMATKGRPHYKGEALWMVSDATQLRFRDIDFGWGKAVYGGPPNAMKMGSSYVPSKNAHGQEGLVIAFCLPGETMERFVNGLDTMLKPRLITSSL